MAVNFSWNNTRRYKNNYNETFTARETRSHCCSPASQCQRHSPWITGVDTTLRQTTLQAEHTRHATQLPVLGLFTVPECPHLWQSLIHWRVWQSSYSVFSFDETGTEGRRGTWSLGRSRRKSWRKSWSQPVYGWGTRPCRTSWRSALRAGSLAGLQQAGPANRVGYCLCGSFWLSFSALLAAFTGWSVNWMFGSGLILGLNVCVGWLLWRVKKIGYKSGCQGLVKGGTPPLRNRQKLEKCWLYLLLVVPVSSKFCLSCCCWKTELLNKNHIS